MVFICDISVLNWTRFGAFLEMSDLKVATSQIVVDGTLTQCPYQHVQSCMYCPTSLSN